MHILSMLPQIKEARALSICPLAEMLSPIPIQHLDFCGCENLCFSNTCTPAQGFLHGASGKEPTCRCRGHEPFIRSLVWEDPLKDGMQTHSSILALTIPWIEEPQGRKESDTTEATEHTCIRTSLTVGTGLNIKLSH